jgi:hypothetical protein
VEKYGSAGQGGRWQYKTVHTLCMLDNQGYKHTLRIFYFCQLSVRVPYRLLRQSWVEDEPFIYFKIITNLFKKKGRHLRKSPKHAYSSTVCLPQFVAVNRDTVLRNFFSEVFVGYK